MEMEKSFSISALLHPPTYIDKIVLGSEEGGLRLWHVGENRMIHDFDAAQVGTSRITCMANAPALDIIAVGHTSGVITVFHLKAGKRLLQFRQDGPVTALSFRTEVAGVPMLASADDLGDITLWDLQAKRLIHVLHHAHDAAITSLHFLLKQPLLMSTGADNTIKVFTLRHLVLYQS